MTPLHCPLCPAGADLRPLDPHLFRRPLRRCDSCRGLLADSSTVTATSGHYHASHYVMVEGHGRHRCRACGELFDRARERCRTCREPQTIGCARCLAPMELVEVAGVSIDVCRGCRLVWFDRGELGLLVGHHSSELQRCLTAPAAARSLPHDLVLTSLDVGPTVLEAARAASSAAVELAGDTSVSAVTALGEGAVQVTSGAIELLVEIVAGIF